MIRCRATYQKSGPLRYISHLDLQKVWTRVLLRAKLPLAYTQGFHHVPKMASAWPLPLGWDGQNELVDLWFDFDPANLSENDLPQITGQLNRQTPVGLHFRSIEIVELYSPSITALIQSADYLIYLDEAVNASETGEKIEVFKQRSEIMRARRGKKYNLKSLIENDPALIHPDPDHVAISICMTARDSAMGRPDEFADELGLDPESLSYSRERFYLADPADMKNSSAMKS